MHRELNGQHVDILLGGIIQEFDWLGWLMSSRFASGLSKEDAEDAIQDTCHTVLDSKRETYAQIDRSSLERLFVGHLKNAVKRHQRQEERWHARIEWLSAALSCKFLESCETRFERREIVIRILRAIKQRSEIERRVARYVFLRGDKLPDAARRARVRLETARNAHRRLRRFLQNCFGRYENF